MVPHPFMSAPIWTCMHPSIYQPLTRAPHGLRQQRNVANTVQHLKPCMLFDRVTFPGQCSSNAAPLACRQIAHTRPCPARPPSRHQKSQGGRVPHLRVAHHVSAEGGVRQATLEGLWQQGRTPAGGTPVAARAACAGRGPRTLACALLAPRMRRRFNGGRPHGPVWSLGLACWSCMGSCKLVCSDHNSTTLLSHQC
jgi:hypothetical protein